MAMKRRTEKVTKEKVGSQEDSSKCAGLNIQDQCPVQTIGDYQCSGNLEMDFPGLCALVGISEIPLVKLRQPIATSPSTTNRTIDNQNMIEFGNSVTWCPKPCLQVENEDLQRAKSIIISGWRVDEKMAEVLSKILPSQSNLQSLKMWQARLTDHVLTSLKNTISVCANLRTVILEGNPIPEQSYHILIGEDSMITHLSLRNNRIGEEGARLIGSALSTANSDNKNLLTLNMAFNSVGDGGAIHIAQGLRLNRSLLYLSLANNHITDAGGICVAEVLGHFALTHEEIVERRRLLIQRDQLPSHVVSADPISVASSSSLEHISKGSKSASKKKKDEKPAANQIPATVGKKEESKMTKKDTKVPPRMRGGKSGGKDKRPSGLEQEEQISVVQKTGEVVEAVSPLLDPGIQHTDGKVIHPGNLSLFSLNLSGNQLTEKSLQKFLSSVAGQGEGGLLRLSLNRNRFSPDCDTFLKIQEILSLKNPQNKTNSCQMDDEQGQAA